jgi:hypothetical protein
MGRSLGQKTEIKDSVDRDLESVCESSKSKIR